MPDDPTGDTNAFDALVQQVQDLSDAFDALNYTTTLKLGPGPQNIQGTVMNSVNFVTGLSGWQMTPDGNLEANNGTFRGALQANSIDIPDTTTTASFHVDTSGNAWWGSNIANGITQALASITPGGVATFKNILIGGAMIQYQVVNSGIFTFGDGSDGAAAFDGSATPTGSTKSGNDYTLTRDVYYTDMTVSTGCTVNPAGYRIFGTGTFTLNGTGKIFRNGNNGAVGSSGVPHTGGAGGAALADGYLKGSAAGGIGGNSTSTVNGGNGADTSNSIGSNGAAGGAGGNGDGNVATSPGSAGTATASNVKLIANWHLATLLDVGSTGATVKFDNSAGSGGGGGGGQASGGAGRDGAGGGGGSAGGIVAIYFRAIVIGASASITANGGTGGKGGDQEGTGGGGGGGGGGNGGQIILVYNTLSNSGSLTAAGGNGGALGSGYNNGVAGGNGAAGTIRQFQVSM